MSAPIPASSSAVARPMPRPAPVTIATCPESSMSDLLSCDGTDARASGLDGLGHASSVQRGQLVLPEAENLRQHTVRVLTEERSRAGDGRRLGAMQADRRDRDLRLPTPRVLDLFPDPARVQVGSGAAFGPPAPGPPGH